MQKLLTFFQQKISAFCVSLDVNFNESLTNDVVSFEQPGPGLGLLKGKCQQFLKALSARVTSIFSFPGDNLSNKYQWIFTKLGMCIAIVEIWFEVANRQISSNFDRVICPPQILILFLDNKLSKSQLIFIQLHMFIDTVETWFGIANGYISSFFDSVISP